MKPLRERTFPPGLFYDPYFVSESQRREILTWLKTIRPIWEWRFSKNHPPPEGERQRQLLRPVYWLGNWQFACLNYYRPPKGIHNRCIAAEPFPPVLARLVAKIERQTHRLFAKSRQDIPPGWHLNTCLVNLYGSSVHEGKRVDTARVGEHKDFEPGPVASVSLGERAMFQFVESRQRGQRDGVALEQWLEDSSLQIFGGRVWKERLFHRVQRVDSRDKYQFDLNVEDFETRRINFTFRYVPDRHIVPFSRLPKDCFEDVEGYMKQLAEHSSFFRKACDARKR